MVLLRLAETRKELNDVVNHLEPSLMTWAPREGMRTIAGQLIEIAGSELQVVEWLQNACMVSDEEVLARIETTEDLDRLKEFLAEVRAQSLAYLEGLSDAELAEAVPIPRWHESLGLPTVPRGEIFIGVCQHESYHMGQLVSYLWARGDDPYEW